MAKIRVRHILVQHRFEAEDILKKISAGGNFEDLAKRHSTCPSAAEGGDLGEVDPRRLDDDFREALEDLKDGQMSGIVRTRFGHHLIKRGSDV